MTPQDRHPPRVCMLMESFYPVVGGMESQARNVIRGMAAFGIPMLVVTRRVERALPREETIYGVPVHRVGPVGPVAHARWLMAAACLPALIRLRRQYDIILVPGFRTLGISAVIAAKLLGKVAILNGASSGEFSGEFFSAGLGTHGLKRNSLLMHAVLGARNRLFAHADALVSLSTEMTEEFTSAGAPPGLVLVIPNTLDDEKFKPATAVEKLELRRKLGLPADHLLVAFSGRVVTYKGVPRLLRVWEDICRARSRVQLLILGGGGGDIHNCEAEARQFIATRNMTDRIRMTGFVDNVDDYLRAADIFVFPTENEAFPLALLEAMACRLPIVATAVGGIKDAIENGASGLLIPPADEAALREGLDRMLDDSALRETLAAAALRTIRERYLPATVAAQYQELFLDCLLHHGSSAKKANAS